MTPGSTDAAGHVSRATATASPLEPALDRAAICARKVDTRGAVGADKKPFAAREQHCAETDEPFCTTVTRSPDPNDSCFVADDNIARAARSTRKGAPASASTAWDGRSPLKYLDRIDAHLHLRAAEREKLRANHFVVLDRLAYGDYANAFHDIFQEQLPLYVGVDPILHAVFAGTEHALGRIERYRLVPALTRFLKKTRGALRADRTMSAEQRRDLDVYLGVAQALFDVAAADETRTPAYSVTKTAEDEITKLVEKSGSGGQLESVRLFGRDRMIDLSQLTPRGHYEEAWGFGEGRQSLREYFRAMMWLSRVELNLVSRSSRSSSESVDPRETPREAKDALALSELVAQSGADAELAVFEDIYGTFAGKREDVSPAALHELATKNGIHARDADAADKLKAAIGAGFVRTANTHFRPEGARDLPVILTVFGPRIVPDVAPLSLVVHDKVPDRYLLGAGDVGYALGHDRALHYIADRGRFPALASALRSARTDMASGAAASKNLYGTWLRSVLALADRPSGVAPSFASSEAYDDHRLDSALVGYGQIRHTFVLLAAQGYDTNGCEIPDAYVEPLPAVWDALLAHVRLLRTKVDPKSWGGLERGIAKLAEIAHDEAAGRLLTVEQKRWLGMVSEHVPVGGWGDSGEPPKWTGWYFDMFEDREQGATKQTAFIADYFTLTNANRVAYLGSENPRIGIYVVDVNGEPRAMVGPVAKGFEAHAPIEGRLADGSVFEPATAALEQAPWRASFAAPSDPAPALGLEGVLVRCGDGEPESETNGFVMMNPSAPVVDAGPPKPAEWRIAIRSTRATAGATTVTLLDHHGDPLSQALRIDVGASWKVAAFDMPQTLARSRHGVEALHVRVEDLAPSGTGKGPFDYTSSPSVFARFSPMETAAPPGLRPAGTAPFAIGAR